MITPERSVCLLELSKRIKELGVKQESLWWWDLRRKKEDCDVGDKPKDEWILSYEECYQGDRDDLISAFTTSELGEMLPMMVTIDNYNCHLEIHKHSPPNTWNVVYYHPHKYTNFEADTLVNAMAKMLIYLLENKLVKI